MILNLVLLKVFENKKSGIVKISVDGWFDYSWGAFHPVDKTTIEFSVKDVGDNNYLRFYSSQGTVLTYEIDSPEWDQIKIEYSGCDGVSDSKYKVWRNEGNGYVFIGEFGFDYGPETITGYFGG